MKFSPLVLSLSCTVLSGPVLSCPVLSCPILSCPVLSCPVLSCPVVLYPFAPVHLRAAVEPVTDLSHVRLICMGFGILPDAKSLAGDIKLSFPLNVALYMPQKKLPSLSLLSM